MSYTITIDPTKFCATACLPMPASDPYYVKEAEYLAENQKLRAQIVNLTAEIVDLKAKLAEPEVISRFRKLLVEEASDPVTVGVFEELMPDLGVHFFANRLFTTPKLPESYVRNTEEAEEYFFVNRGNPMENANHIREARAEAAYDRAKKFTQ